MAICDNCQLPIIDENINGDLCNACLHLIKKETPVEIKPLERNDLELVLAWRSNPEIYRHFRKQDGPIEWDDHVNWFESRPDDRNDFVIQYKGRRVGVINVNQDNQVGLYVGEVTAQKNGIATIALNWLCNRFSEKAPLYAEIHMDNEPSKHLFEKVGFRQRKEDGGWIKYIYDP